MAGPSDKVPYYEQVAAKLIEQLAAGTAPWQKLWEPGTLSLPHNPVSGTRYKGSNAIWLEAQSRGDPRWMTYRQAASIEAQVRKGEKGILVQYWKFTDKIPVKDERGRPVLDQEGNTIYRNVPLERPKVFSAVVFNAEQIDGLPPLEAKAPAWDRHARAEALLLASGAEIRHDQADRAFYRPATDRIHLPERGGFKTADAYYATAMHELGHWTGHPSRLDRDLAHPFGSEGYAKEELRAEIASLMLGDELGMGHDPGQHAAYVKTWIKTLQEDPKEILRAAKDADRITAFILDFERARAVEPEPVPVSEPVRVPVIGPIEPPAVPRPGPVPPAAPVPTVPTAVPEPASPVAAGPVVESPIVQPPGPTEAPDIDIPLRVRIRLEALLSKPKETLAKLEEVRKTLGTRYVAEVWIDARPEIAATYERMGKLLGTVPDDQHREAVRRYLVDRLPSSYVTLAEAEFFRGDRGADLPRPNWAQGPVPYVPDVVPLPGTPSPPTSARPPADGRAPAPQPEGTPRNPRYSTAAGENLAKALKRRDLKAAIDVLRPLSLQKAQIAAIEAGLSVPHSSSKQRFFADIQSQLLKATRALAREPAPEKAAVPEKSPNPVRDDTLPGPGTHARAQWKSFARDR
jgi:antirestriction protein ArdC